MRLHLVQNEPFTPMADAWRRRSRHLVPMGQLECRTRLSQVYARVLSNATPPYSVGGGVYEALTDTHGETYRVSNGEAVSAGETFTEQTGLIPCPEAAVAFAGLLQAVQHKKVGPADCVLLHVTGGGWDRLVSDYGKIAYPVTKSLKRENADEAANLIEQYLDVTLATRGCERT